MGLCVLPGPHSPITIMITLQLAIDHLKYDAATGYFYWIPGKGKFGWDYDKPAGRTEHDGYIVIRIKGNRITGHRLAWLMTYGYLPMQNLDHKNGNKADNRISNLRLATSSQNLHNKPKTKANKSGIKGVSWDRHRQKWLAQLQVQWKNHNLGLFNSKEAAANAVQAFRNFKLGEFAHH